MCILDPNGVPSSSLCNIQKLLQCPFTTLPSSTQFQLFKTGRPKPSLPDFHITTRNSLGTIEDEVIIDKSFYEKTNWIAGCSTNNKLYCWPCLLFGKNVRENESVWTTTGYSEQSNTTSFRKEVNLHREHHGHLQSLLVYINYDKEYSASKYSKLSDSEITPSNKTAPECVVVDDNDDDVQVITVGSNDRPTNRSTNSHAPTVRVQEVISSSHPKSSTSVVTKKNTSTSKQHPSKTKNNPNSSNKTSNVPVSNSQALQSTNAASPQPRPSTTKPSVSTSKPHPSINKETSITSTNKTPKLPDSESQDLPKQACEQEPQDVSKDQTLPPVLSNLKFNDKGHFKCEVCNKSFKMLSHLKLHAKTHPKITVHTCTACLQSYSCVKLLSKHIKTVHQGTNIGVVKELLHKNHLTHACSYCNFNTGSSAVASKLVDHLLTQHEIEYPLTCRFCDAKFENFANCKDHLKKIHNSKIYTCNFCTCVFDTITKLEIHVLQIHTKVHKYECSICKKKFIHEQYYKEHLEGHKAVQELEFTESIEDCQFNEGNLEIVDKIPSSTREIETVENSLENIYGRCAGIAISMITKVSEVYKVGDSIINYNDNTHSDTENEEDLQSNPIKEDELDMHRVEDRIKTSSSAALIATNASGEESKLPTSPRRVSIDSERTESRNEFVPVADKIIEDIIDLGNGKRILVPVVEQSRCFNGEQPESPVNNNTTTAVRPCSIQLDRTQVLQYYEQMRDSGKELTFQLTDLYPQLSLKCQVNLDRSEVTNYLAVPGRQSSDEAAMDVCDDDNMSSGRPSPCPSIEVGLQEDNSLLSCNLGQDKYQDNLSDNVSVSYVHNSTINLKAENKTRRGVVDSSIPTKISIATPNVYNSSMLLSNKASSALTPKSIQPSITSTRPISLINKITSKTTNQSISLIKSNVIVPKTTKTLDLTKVPISNNPSLPTKAVRTIQPNILSKSLIKPKSLSTSPVPTKSLPPFIYQQGITVPNTNQVSLSSETGLKQVPPTIQMSHKKVAEEPLKKTWSLPTCTECGNFCANESNLKVHKAMHSFSSTFNNLYCESCKIYHVSSCSFNIHQHLSHKNELFPNHPVIEIDGHTLHKCHLCLSVFTDKNLFYIHCHPYTCYSQLSLYCTICNLKFTSKEIFESHAENHAPNQCTMCNICSQKFSSYSELTAHVKSDHNVKAIHCVKCGTDIPASIFLLSHLKECKGPSSEIMQCSCCSVSVTGDQAMIKHVQEHTGKLKYDFICRCCLKSFPTLENFVYHKKKQHPKLIKYDYDHYKIENITNSTGHQKFILSKSDVQKNYVYSVSVGKKIENIYNFSSPDSIKYFSMQNVLVTNCETPGQLNVMFTCKICKSRMLHAQEGHLEAHLAAHKIVSGLSDLPCLYCGSVCKSTIDLEMHVEIHHNTCKICHQILHTKQNYVKHEVDHAEGLCHVLTCICGRDFKLLEQFEKHIINEHKADTVDGNTIVIYKRPITKISFNYESQHPQCPYCNKYFKSNIYLKNHMRKIHSVHECELCKKLYVKSFYQMKNSYFMKSDEPRKVAFQCILYEPTNSHCAECVYSGVKTTTNKPKSAEVVIVEMETQSSDSGQGSELPEKSDNQDNMLFENVMCREDSQDFVSQQFEDFKIEIVDDPLY